jgi:AraC family transcriptional regulator of adaptative response / DNA-3-methyladenine glycosylase II
MIVLPRTSQLIAHSSHIREVAARSENGERDPDADVTLAVVDEQDTRYYRALCARDRRFDGLFFVGVSTTGVYCRPICPARTPGRTRCRFFKRAAEAERAGFRACFRCRPERAPGDAHVDAAPVLERRALRAIGAGALDRGSVDALAAELGVGTRHLRRTIERAVGASPLELAQTRRLGLAKQLLQDTRLPVTEIAFAAGFGSLRRFHAAVRARFACAPTQLRRGASPRSDEPSLRLETRAPFAADVMFRFLAAHAIPGLEEVGPRSWRRVVVSERGAGWMELVATDPSALRMRVDAVLLPMLAALVERARMVFDLDAHPALVDAYLARDARLAPLVARHPGVRVPGAFDPWEVLVRTVLAQQVSARAARTLCARLIERFGTPVPIAAGEVRCFPTPAQLMDAGARLRTIGLPAARARTLDAIARAVVTGQLALAPSTDPALALERLRALPGVGDWTAQAFALHALRDPDAFLAGDLALRRTLGRISSRELARRAEAWRPWRAYALMHLWNADQGGAA